MGKHGWEDGAIWIDDRAGTMRTPPRDGPSAALPELQDAPGRTSSVHDASMRIDPGMQEINDNRLQRVQGPSVTGGAQGIGSC